MHETFPLIIPGSFHFEQVSNDIIRKEIQNLMLKSHQHMVRFLRQLQLIIL